MSMAAGCDTTLNTTSRQLTRDLLGSTHSVSFVACFKPDTCATSPPCLQLSAFIDRKMHGVSDVEKSQMPWKSTLSHLLRIVQ